MLCREAVNLLCVLQANGGSLQITSASVDRPGMADRHATASFGSCKHPGRPVSGVAIAPNLAMLVRKELLSTQPDLTTVSRTIGSISSTGKSLAGSLFPTSLESQYCVRTELLCLDLNQHHISMASLATSRHISVIPCRMCSALFGKNT